MQPGHPERLDPDQVYGSFGSDSSITEQMAPWAGNDWWGGKSVWPVRPWYPPEDQPEKKTCKDPSVVTPPCYDTLPTYGPVYAEGDPGAGIGGYDLLSPADNAFAFDYEGSGRLDHLVLYRPGTGIIWILRKKDDGSFEHVMQSSGGIGGYDLLSPADRAFAFDYEGSGRLDHLVLYRPGTGIMWILKKKADGTFVLAYGESGPGIGGYDLLSPADRAFAFDYEGSGRLDHLVLYRPGTGIIWILRKKDDGSFEHVMQNSGGIGGYDLLSPADFAFAFDYEGSGRLDHLVLYRPGTGTIWILKHTPIGIFKAVYQQGDPGNGIGGYDLRSGHDRAFAFDYNGIGILDHLVLYRPGTGTICVLRNKGGVFEPVYAEGDPGKGIGGYDLLSWADRAFAFDYGEKRFRWRWVGPSGWPDHLVLYRSETGTIWILERPGCAVHPGLNP